MIEVRILIKSTDEKGYPLATTNLSVEEFLKLRSIFNKIAKEELQPSCKKITSDDLNEIVKFYYGK